MEIKPIKLGYEVNTGKEVFVRASHLVVTGVTQLAGKTTCIEALIKRSGLKAIVFKTKIGEKSFTEGTEIPPFFRDRSDYDFVKSLIEAYAKEKLYLEKGTLMNLCKGSSSLIDIKRRVDERIADGDLRGIKEEIHTRLQHYLANLIPQIQYANLSKTLVLHDGINIMNLERFSEEAQSLILQSVADEILKTMHDTVLVLPEAWKFVPQKYNNPCKRCVESFIRQGAANNNFVFLDSQEMASVDKVILKQVSTWILGLQTERNEVKHTLDQIRGLKPSEDEIMSLKVGHFYLTHTDGVKKVYAQPAWMDNEVAKLVSMNTYKLEDVKKPERLVPYSIAPQMSKIESISSNDSSLRKEMMELRSDFFNKIQELQNGLNKSFEAVYALETSIDIDEIVGKVLQKIPTSIQQNKVINSNSDTPSEANIFIQKLGGGMSKKIYEALLSHKEGLTKAQLGLMTGYTYTSGSFSVTMSKLKTMGLIKKEGEAYKAVLK